MDSDGGVHWSLKSRLVAKGPRRHAHIVGFQNWVKVKQKPLFPTSACTGLELVSVSSPFVT